MPDNFVQSVELVSDIGTIPNSLPRPVLPELRLIPSLIAPAVAIGEDNIFLATTQLGKALNQALRAARKWVAEQEDQELSEPPEE